MASDYSQHESARFGFPIHRAYGETPAEVDAAVASATQAGAELLILRFPTGALDVAADVSARPGFILGDVLVYYRRPLEGLPAIDTNEGYTVRLAEPADRGRVEPLAISCFEGYENHYRANPRTSNVEALAEGYGEWAGSFCTEPDWFCVLIESNGELVAFAGNRMEGDLGVAVLFGVHGDHQRQRLAQRLMQESLHEMKVRGASVGEFSSQLHNPSALKLWARSGFELDHSSYTVHIDLRG